jgi:hypothetical protein
LRFWLKLSRTLGKTLAETMHAVSVDEFVLHLADYQLEPWGDERSDMRAVAIAQIITATRGIKTKYEDLHAMVNPWAKWLTSAPRLPTKQELAEKIRRFNASLATKR